MLHLRRFIICAALLASGASAYAATSANMDDAFKAASLGMALLWVAVCLPPPDEEDYDSAVFA